MIVRMNLLLNRTVVLPVTDASTTCAVVIFSVKVSCITSVLYYGHWCDWSIKVLSTRIRFHLKTQLFLYGHSFRAHLSDENDQWKRNFSKTLSRVELFENAVFVCTCRGGQTKTEISKTLKTHSSNPLCAILELTYSRRRTGASLSCVLHLGLFLT